MVIRIRQSSEPMSRASVEPFVAAHYPDGSRVSADSLGIRSGIPTITARSHASRVLEHELTRYCNGETQGRSFLIAGHRGAGKTTMVLEVIDRVIRASRKGDVPMRPLKVLLHGPSLFQTPSGMRSDAEKDSEANAKLALEQIILGLHRAVVKEYTQAYRADAGQRAVIASTRSDPSLPRSSTVNRSLNEGVFEWSELAAQFEIEMMEDPPAARLREFYSYIGALPSGVLPSCGMLFNGMPSADQAARELVALNGVCTAHQRISGRLNEKDRRRQNYKRETETKTNVEIKNLDTLKSIVPVISGAAVGGGAAAGPHELWQSVLLGVLTTIGASFALAHSSKSTTRRERQVDRTFIPDLSLRTLDRVLPTLLERLMSAGLAPVFVIDELDKVKGLSDRLVEMARHLKKLMAEGVFSCFLTDRGYLEFLTLDERDRAYGMAYSYFSHPLLLAYEPADYDRFMADLFDDSDSIASQLDCEVLRWVLRHRSQMHAMALNREIAALRNDANEISIPEGAVRTLRLYQIDATIQVTIEYHLNLVAGWVTQRPMIRQTLFDGLYYITRQWLSGVDALDLSDAGLAALRRELEGRMNLDEVRGDELDGDAGNDAGGRLPAVLRADDLAYLFGVVRAIAHDLSDNALIRITQSMWTGDALPGGGQSRAPVPAQSVLDALLSNQLSVLISGENSSFRFRYLPSGELRGLPPLAAGPVPGVQAPAGFPTVPSATSLTKSVVQLSLDAREHADVIDHIEQILWTICALPEDGERPNGRLFQLLTDQMRVLPTTPAWSLVKSAMERLAEAAYGRGNVAELEVGLAAVVAFKDMLIGQMGAIGAVLATGALAGGLGGNRSLAISVRKGLDALSNGVQFAQLDLGGVQVAMNQCQSEIEKRYSARLVAVPMADPNSPSDPGEAIVRWASDWHEQGLELASKSDSRRISALAWDSLVTRLQIYFLRMSTSTASIDEIVCATNGTGPSRLLGINVAVLSLGDWTRALLAGLAQTREKNGASEHVPIEIVGFALRNLGFARLDRKQVQLLLDDIQSRRGASDEEMRSLSAAAFSGTLSSEDVPPRCVIVVRAAQNSATRNWLKPPTRALFLVTTAAELLAALPHIGELLALDVPLRLTWEVRPDESSSEVVVNALNKFLNFPVGETPVFGEKMLAQMQNINSPDYPDELAFRLFMSSSSSQDTR